MFEGRRFGRETSGKGRLKRCEVSLAIAFNSEGRDHRFQAYRGGRTNDLKTRALDISIYGLLIVLAAVLLISERSLSKFITRCGDFISQSLFL